MAGFNNEQRRQTYLQALQQSFSNPSIQRCLYIGDGLLLPLLILEFYPKIELIILQSTNIHLTHTLEAILSNSSTELKYRIIPSLDREHLDGQTIDMIVSEPSFSKSILPWDNLHFYYFLQKHRAQFRPDVKLFPGKARLRCLALQFDHLHKIRSPVKQCCQLDLSPFDEQILAASYRVDAIVEPQSLFEYSSKKPTLSPIIDLIDIDFHADHSGKTDKIALTIPIKENGICNGIAFWIDYQLDETIWLTTGVKQENDPWVKYSKQGVHLLRQPIAVQPGMNLKITTAFDYQQGQFLFDMID